MLSLDISLYNRLVCRSNAYSIYRKRCIRNETAKCVACLAKRQKSELVCFTTGSNREEWIRRSGGHQVEKRLEKTPETRQFLCLSHFCHGDFDSRGRIKNSALPLDKKEELSNILTTPASNGHDYLFTDYDNIKGGKLQEIVRFDIPVDDPTNYIPSFKGEDVDNDSDEEDEEKEEIANTFNYFMVARECLLELLKFCPICSKVSTVTLKNTGFHMKAYRKCPNGHSSTWNSGSVMKNSENTRRQMKKTNMEVAAASFVTGSSYTKLQHFFRTLNMPLLSGESFHRIQRNHLNEAVSNVFDRHQKIVLSHVQEKAKNIGGVHLAGDGAYDSRGYSAFFCRYVIQDCETKLVITTSENKKIRGDKLFSIEISVFSSSSAQLEVIGHKKALQKAIDLLPDSKVLSITTDRNQDVHKTMDSEFPDVQHLYDGWHFLRNMALDFVAMRSVQYCSKISDWEKSLKNHLYWSIQSSDGNGELAYEKMMSSILHICDIHKDFERYDNIYPFKLVTACSHGENEHDESLAFLNIDKDSRAIRRLINVLNTGSRKKDLESVSPKFSTSSVESFNNRCLYYTPKELFFSERGYTVRTQLAIMDWNEKQLEEMSGERTVQRQKKYYNKTSRRESYKNQKTPASHKWRQDILQEAISMFESKKLLDDSLDTDSTEEDEVGSEDESAQDSSSEDEILE